MAIRIRLNNVVLEVDNESDLRTALDALGALPSGQTSPNGRRAVRGRHIDPMAELAKGLPANQKTVLRLLANNDEPVADADLVKALKMNSNLDLGGVMAGLTKNARKVGLTWSDLLIKGERTNGAGNRAHTYQIAPRAREQFRSKRRKSSSR